MCMFYFFLSISDSFCNDFNSSKLDYLRGKRRLVGIGLLSHRGSQAHPALLQESILDHIVALAPGECATRTA